MNGSVILGPGEFARALRVGFDALELNRALLDRLNVFPVPDGDTGTNMTATLSAGIEALPGSGNRSFAVMAEVFNRELNRGSRGNSGFILARFFHGFFETASQIKDEVLSVRNLAAGFANGSFRVRGALFSPVEGTMVSILHTVSEALADTAVTDPAEAFDLIDQAGTEALFHTPNQLPVLARAGVVDSGALGLLCLFRGMRAALRDEQPALENEELYRFEPDPDAGAGDEESRFYRYCTEAVVRRNGKEDPSLDSWLAGMGNSIALVRDSEILKLHIHTNEPGEIFSRLETLGNLDHTKVDDMELQTRLVSAATGSAKGCAVLAFVPGEGFERIFEDLGIDHCFLYQDVLPSPDEIAAALNGIDAGHVIVLANNSNILPSVMAARELTDKAVSIIPSRTVIQGLTAAYGYSLEEGAAGNVQAMSGFLDDAVGLFVYRSSRDTRYGDKDLIEGEWFVTRFDDILGSGADPASAVVAALEILETDGFTNVAVYHGGGFDPRDLRQVMDAIAGNFPEADLEDHYGGQVKAALIISLE